MRVGLIDVDGHNYPNLPLMKLSAWHKSKGDSVEWYQPLFSGHMDVDIDELSEVLRSNTSFIYQKAATKLLGRDYFNSLSHKLEEEYPYRLDD